MNDSGSFAIVYPDTLTDTSIEARNFQSSGQPLSPTFQVSQHASDRTATAAVAVAQDGTCIFAWTASDDSGSGIWARRFDASGNPLGNEFRVNSYTAGDQGSPEIAATGDGGFMIAWSGPATGGGTGVFERRFLSDGTPAGAELCVATGAAGEPQVAAATDGRFVVAWSSPDGDGNGVFAQRFATDGALVGGSCPFHPARQATRRLLASGWRMMVISWLSGRLVRAGLMLGGSPGDAPLHRILLDRGCGPCPNPRRIVGQFRAYPSPSIVISTRRLLVLMM